MVLEPEKYRVGVLVPFTNTNLEPDLTGIQTTALSFHFTRIAGYDTAAVPSIDEMAAMAEAPVRAAFDLLMAIRPRLFLYGCTSAMLALGPEFEKRAAAQMSAYAGAPVVTAAGAIVAALKELAVSSIAICSPYNEPLTRVTADFFRNAGSNVTSTAKPPTALRSLEQGALAPEAILELAEKADHPEAEAIVIPCTDLRAVSCIEALENRLGKPVVTSNQALMWATTTHLKPASGKVPGALGRRRSARREATLSAGSGTLTNGAGGGQSDVNETDFSKYARGAC